MTLTTRAKLSFMYVLATLLMLFHWAFVRDWDELAPEQRLPAILFMIAFGLVLGGVIVLFMIWYNSVMV